VADVIGFAVYSARMDQNTCAPCKEADGTEGPPGGDPELPTPNPFCLGGDRCRCIWVPVVTDLAPLPLPEEEELPPVIRVPGREFEAWLADWVEREHPRDRQGRFRSKGGEIEASTRTSLPATEEQIGMMLAGQIELPATVANMEAARKASGAQIAAPGVEVFDPTTGESFSAAPGDYFGRDEDQILLGGTGEPGSPQLMLATVERIARRPGGGLTVGDIAGAEHHDLAPPPDIDPEIERQVYDNASAKAFLAEHGVELAMDDFEGNPHFWREICQAVADAQTKFPILREGGKHGRLTRITLFSQLPEDVQAKPSDNVGLGKAYAVTSWDVADAETTTITPGWEPGTTLPPGAREGMRSEAGIDVGQVDFHDAWITLYDPPPGTATDGPETEGAEGDENFRHGWALQTDRWVYGKLMHELGHAVSQLSGAEWMQPSREELFDGNGLEPAEIARFSAYATGDISEAWAEVFEALNGRGGIDGVPEDLRPMLTEIQRVANQWAQAHDVPGGKIL
jgi:hypothetical protein